MITMGTDSITIANKLIVFHLNLREKLSLPLIQAHCLTSYIAFVFAFLSWG